MGRDEAFPVRNNADRIRRVGLCDALLTMSSRIDCEDQCIINLLLPDAVKYHCTKDSCRQCLQDFLYADDAPEVVL